ncbi:hypothetical protein MIT9_P1726 [Methylomarinovum caldicuralii]|uniref:DUF2334 domain-containing protein n=1 Tax=Methylomarinovum caldicuralii TaxID=438856 RepID=A0AAU9CKF1_9GAMM|nr:hypothetical protein [Methylomarinovum caldicuralii]BCX82141.1 hypothetical protein MIT9_P1726 [Methylomarinovum caldicuralii]
MSWKERLHPLAAPVLEQPVLIIESDDWGPGSREQVRALESLRALLRRFRDRNGNPAMMTIGVVLSIPHPEAIAATGEYHARHLDAPDYQPIVEALKAGEEEGVFALQLHGMAHFWPENFMTAWRRDDAIKRWLAEDGWRTERLPPWLQSRWIDATGGLPSRPLSRQVLQAAVQEEVERFRRCFGTAPRVAVPPTFVWDENVERAYAAAGIEVLITPGRRYSGRDAKGRLTAPECCYYHGEPLACGLKALVRDVYFEPALGHDPEAVLEAIARKWSRREPALLETHRFNFLDDNLEDSLAALERLLRGVLEYLPEVRFLSSRQLAMEAPTAAPLPARLQSAWRRLRR